MKSTLEEWKPIAGYENYMVSSFGCVKSLGNNKKRKEKILKPCKNRKNGYLMVHLCKNRKGKLWTIHRLVGMTFPEICGEWFEGCEVDHINTIKDDNRAENLRVCTRKENCNNPLTLHHKSERILTEETKKKMSLAHLGKPFSEEHKRKLSIINSIPIVQMDMEGNVIREWSSAMEAQRNGYNNGAINRCCKGKLNKHKGYRWMFAEDYYKAQKEKAS